MTKEEIRVRIKLEQLERQADANEKKIEELKKDTLMFCSGRSLAEKKVCNVLAELLDVLGYDLVNRNIILEKKGTRKLNWKSNTPYPKHRCTEKKEKTMDLTDRLNMDLTDRLNMDLTDRINRVATLNAIADEVFERIPNITNQNFLDDIEKCLNILQKIEVIKKTL